MVLAQGVMTLLVVSAAGPVELAASRVTLTGIYNQRGETYLDLVVAELTRAGVVVVTPGQAVERLGAEEKARLFGCKGPAVECAPALAQALGVAGVVQGSIVRVDNGGGHRVSLQVFSAADGQVLATFYEAGVDESGLVRAMERAAQALAEDLLSHPVDQLARAPALHSTSTSPLLRKVAWGILAVAGLSATASAAAVARRVAILEGHQPGFVVPGLDQATSLAVEELRKLGVGAAIICGAALFAWSIVMDLGLRPEPVVPVIGFQPGGATLGLALAF